MLVIWVVLSTLWALVQCEELEPPQATKRKEVITTFEEFGYTFEDYYYWIREEEYEEEVDELILNENTYSNSLINQNLIESLIEEMRSYQRIEYVFDDDLLEEDVIGGYVYYEEFEDGEAFPLWIQENVDDEDSAYVYFDENEFVFDIGDPEYFLMNGQVASHDGQYVAFTYDDLGDERYTMRIVDTQTGELLDDVIENVFYDFFWSTDNVHIIYNEQGEIPVQANKVRIHTVGTSQDEDVTIFHETDDRFEATLERTSSGLFILLYSTSLSSNEVYVLDSNFDEKTLPYLLFHRDEEVYAIIDHSSGDGYFYMMSQSDNSPNYKVERFHDTDFDVIELIQEESDDRYITSIRCMEKYLVVTQWETNFGYPEVYIYFLDTLERQLVPVEEDLVDRDILFSFNDVSYSDDLVDYDPYFSGDYIDIYLTSFTTPGKIYRYYILDDEFEMMAEYKVDGFDPELYVEQRVFVESSDGTVQVPASMVYKKYEEAEVPLWETETDGPRPMFIESYAAYGDIFTPYYDFSVMPYLDRGYIYVIGHLRGGAFRGYEWYLDGKILNKKHTFEDLAAITEYFVDNEYTSSDRIAIKGRSAGGLTVGGAMQLRPELFALVVADVPFVDVILTLMDETLSFAVEEKLEWGDVYIEEEFEYILDYDPYWNISPDSGVIYPKIYLEGDRYDKRVNFWMPLKFAQKMREYNGEKTTDSNDVLLNMYDAGHFGGTGLEEWIEWAREEAYVVQCLSSQDFWFSTNYASSSSSSELYEEILESSFGYVDINNNNDEEEVEEEEEEEGVVDTLLSMDDYDNVLSLLWVGGSLILAAGISMCVIALCLIFIQLVCLRDKRSQKEEDEDDDDDDDDNSDIRIPTSGYRRINEYLDSSGRDLKSEYHDHSEFEEVFNVVQHPQEEVVVDEEEDDGGRMINQYESGEISSDDLQNRERIGEDEDFHQEVPKSHTILFKKRKGEEEEEEEELPGTHSILFRKEEEDDDDSEDEEPESHSILFSRREDDDDDSEDESTTISNLDSSKDGEDYEEEEGGEELNLMMVGYRTDPSHLTKRDTL